MVQKKQGGLKAVISKLTGHFKNNKDKKTAVVKEKVKKAGVKIKAGAKAVQKTVAKVKKVNVKAKAKSAGVKLKAKSESVKKTAQSAIKKIKEKKIVKKTVKKIKEQKPKARALVKKVKKILKKHITNPIISPEYRNVWEAWQTFNPASILIDDKVHFLYRAIGHDGISRFGYASSKDGFVLDDRCNEPAFQDFKKCGGEHKCYSYISGGSWGGCEDPRLVRVDNGGTIHVIYTACNGDLRVNLASIKVDDFLNKNWKWSSAKAISPPGEVHKNWVIFPEKIKGKFAILHSLSPKVLIDYVDTLDFKDGEYIKSHYSPSPESDRWDSYMRGPGPTPIKTEHGWLLFYHAMNHKDMGQYKVGAMLLDLKDPTKILYRSKQPILIPDEYYEMNGFKPGVVYALGAVVKDGDMILYYGGADSYVCAAHTDLKKFLHSLMTNDQKEFGKKLLKVKK